MTTAADRDSRRLNEALWLVLRRYGRQITRRPWISVPALVLPGIGDVLVFYAPPLVVAQLLGAVARDEALTIGMLAPYVLTFTALWFAGEVVWRGAEALIARSEIRGIESLYVEAMDELLAKDLAFFHDNFAGSLTKRTLGYARRFEDVFDVLAFQVDREDRAAGVRHGGALALLAAVDPGAARDAVDHGGARGAAHPAPASARGRTRGRDERAGRARGRLHRQRGGRPRVRPRARRGGDSRGQRAGVRHEDAAVVGLPELPREHDHRADVRADEHARPDRRARTSVSAPRRVWRPSSSRSATSRRPHA